MIRYAALLFGLVIVALGVLGLAAPDTFLTAMHFFQSGHRVYLGGVLRALFGVVIFLAAQDSRWPRVLKVLGAVVILLGILTPISAHPLPTVVLGVFGANFVRPWALSSIVLGLFIVVAVVPPRAFDD
jgi:multisubunit Na+/H+ antiporter MnhG subunit